MAEARVDWRFVGTIFSTRELLQGASRPRKLLFFAGYFFVVAVIGSLIYITQSARQVFSGIAEYGFIAVLAYFWVVQPISLVFLSILFRLVKIEQDNVVVIEDNERGNADIGVIITCHKETTLRESIQACTAHFDVKQIFVIAYSRDRKDGDTVEKILRDAGLEERVNFHFVKQFNKTIALHAGAMQAKNFPRLLVLDAQTILPCNMKFDRRLLCRNVKTICYPVKPNPSSNVSTNEQHWKRLVQLQALDSLMQDSVKALQSHFITVLCPQRSACLWERMALLKCTSKEQILIRDHCARVSKHELR